MVCYFMPFKPGSFKVYSTPTNSFWCCVGTGFENHAKYTEAIYYHDEKGVYVNLFIPSTLNWKDKGITLTQQTRYPEEPTTNLTVSATSAASWPLYLRYPAWATSGATVKINGKKISINQKPGSYIVINRKWNNGDKVEVTYPMTLRAIPTPDNADKAAFAYGPIVLAGAMGTEGIKEPAPYAKDQNDLNNYPIPAGIINTLNVKGKNINEWLKPAKASEALSFTTLNATAGENITMIPYYRLNQQRYVLYWDLK